MPLPLTSQVSSQLVSLSGPSDSLRVKKKEEQVFRKSYNIVKFYDSTFRSLSILNDAKTNLVFYQNFLKRKLHDIR